MHILQFSPAATYLLAKPLRKKTSGFHNFSYWVLYRAQQGVFNNTPAFWKFGGTNYYGVWNKRVKFLLHSGYLTDQFTATPKGNRYLRNYIIHNKFDASTWYCFLYWALHGDHPIELICHQQWLDIGLLHDKFLTSKAVSCLSDGLIALCNRSLLSGDIDWVKMTQIWANYISYDSCAILLPQLDKHTNLAVTMLKKCLIKKYTC